MLEIAEWKPSNIGETEMFKIYESRFLNGRFNNIEEIIEEFLNIGNTEITNRSKKILVS